MPTGLTSGALSLSMLGLCALVACTSSSDEAVEHLAAGGRTTEDARQTLLLAGGEAVDPLLEAVENGDEHTRLQALDVLLSLTQRVDDDRVATAVDQRLQQDPAVSVRVRAASGIGLYGIAGATSGLFAALADAADTVRAAALASLASISSTLSSEERRRLEASALAAADSPYSALRLQAAGIVTQSITAAAEASDGAVARANLELADSILTQALLRLPGQRYLVGRLARVHLLMRGPEAAWTTLQRAGLAVTVPTVAHRPVIDGTVSPGEWSSAVSLDEFYVQLSGNLVYERSETRTLLHIARDTRSLLFCFVAFDAHPDSLISRRHGRDDRVARYWEEDVVELAVSPSLEGLGAAYFTTNSLGALSDVWIQPQGGGVDLAWDSEVVVRSGIREDAWVVEGAIDYGARLPPPQGGEIWGLYAGRGYRARSMSQWPRTSSGPMGPAEYGALRFD